MRTHCVLKTIEAAATHGYPIVVIDGGSPPEFIETMKVLGARFSWPKPEKYPLIPGMDKPVNVFRLGGYDLVMLRRRSLFGKVAA